MSTGATKERIELLDVVRGLAVFGILLVNITFYSTPLSAIMWQVEQWPAWWDKLTAVVIETFVEGKFVAIFSFLFGYGMVILQERTIARGRRFGPLFVRRMSLLMMFGLLHGLFLWFGDILFHYGLLGFVLLLFRNAKDETMRRWAIGLLVLMALFGVMGGGPVDVDMLDEEFARAVREEIAQDLHIYATGTYKDIQPVRFANWVMSTFNQIVFYPQILVMFLLGAYSARRRLLHDVAKQRAALVTLARRTGVVGVGLGALRLLVSVGGGSSSFGGFVVGLAATVGAPALGLFYVALLALLSTKEAVRRWLRPFGAVGCMAFTNYILQSVVCTLLFYGYGFGLYGRVGPLGTTVIAIGLFALQVVVSPIWLGRFRMGPLEWLWRVGTYGTLSPITTAAGSVATRQ